MEKISIMGIKIGDRVNNSKVVQEILTEYGCSIKTRLGLHEVGNDGCSREGLIILELVGDSDKWNELKSRLEKLSGVEVQDMKFDL